MDFLTIPIVKEIFKFFGFDDDARKQLKNWRASLGRPQYFHQMPDLRYGQLTISDWVVMEGVFPEGIAINAVVDDNVPLQLPPGFEAHKAAFLRVNGERQEKQLEPNFYNGPLISMYSFYPVRSEDKHERPIFRIKATHSGFMDYACTIASLDGPLYEGSGTVRENFFPNWDGEVSAKLPGMGCPGLTLAVITRDERMIMVKRGPNVSVAAGAWHCSVDEGVRPEDAVDGKVDYVRVAYRGLKRELGIEAKAVSEPPKITSMGYSRGMVQYGAIGHVFLDVLLKDVMADISKAKEGRENEAWKAIPFTPKALSKELKRMIKDAEPAIPSFGLATLIMALHGSRRYTLSQVHDHFNDKAFLHSDLVFPRPDRPADIWAFRDQVAH